jgi:hypothetical protein
MTAYYASGVRRVFSGFEPSAITCARGDGT